MDVLTEKLMHALRELMNASLYAADTKCDRWDFAVGIRRLKEIGLSMSDMRWMVCKGFVEHAREVTLLGDDGRSYRSTGNLTFHKRTSFILTDAGIHFVRSKGERTQQPLVTDQDVPEERQSDNNNGHYGRPHWDSSMRELCLNGSVVKRFKWQAMNQEIVLSAFEEDGWPLVIADPLPPKHELDPKQRLHDTIKGLNRNQQSPLIRFHGDGTGQGVRWELVPVEGAN